MVVESVAVADYLVLRRSLVVTGCLVYECSMIMVAESVAVADYLVLR